VTKKAVRFNQEQMSNLKLSGMSGFPTYHSAWGKSR